VTDLIPRLQAAVAGRYAIERELGRAAQIYGVTSNSALIPSST